MREQKTIYYKVYTRGNGGRVAVYADDQNVFTALEKTNGSIGVTHPEQPTMLRVLVGDPQNPAPDIENAIKHQLGSQLLSVYPYSRDLTLQTLNSMRKAAGEARRRKDRTEHTGSAAAASRLSATTPAAPTPEASAAPLSSLPPLPLPPPPLGEEEGSTSTTERYAVLPADLPQEAAGLAAPQTSATIQFKSSNPALGSHPRRRVDGEHPTPEQEKRERFLHHLSEVQVDNYMLARSSGLSAYIMQDSVCKGSLTYTPSDRQGREALTATKIPEQDAFKIIAATMIKMNPDEKTFRIFLVADQFEHFKQAFDEVAGKSSGLSCEQDDSMRPASGITPGRQ